MIVQVYWNVHRSKWSIRDKHSRKVIGHADRICLSNALPKVSEKGRERVNRENRKNVHAFIEGTLERLESTSGQRITYNPYKHKSFVYKETGE